jgi:hypothetical protein
VALFPREADGSRKWRNFRTRACCAEKKYLRRSAHVLARGFVLPDCFTANNRQNLMRSISFRGSSSVGSAPLSRFILA